MFKVTSVSIMLLLFLGFMDCLTTVFGAAFFQVEELNPIMAGLVNHSILAFVTLKLTITVFVTMIFFLVERSLLTSKDKEGSKLKIISKIFKFSLIVVVAFQTIAVVNNISVILAAHF